MNPTTYVAVIVAAGSAARFGEDKTARILQGKTVLRWSVDFFLADSRCIALVVVVEQSKRSYWQEAFAGETDRVFVCAGGATRGESVWLGVQLAATKDCPYVLIHDAARPLLAHQVVDSLLTVLAQPRSGLPKIAAIPVLPIVESVRSIAQAGDASRAVDRNELVTVQTPQAFATSDILQAHSWGRSTGREFTDDASLFEAYCLAHAAAGGLIRHVAGARMTMKITYPEDWAIVSAYAEQHPFSVRA